MSAYPPRRPLGDVVVELANAAADAGRGANSAAGLYTQSVDMTFPIEAMVEMRDGEMIVVADMPRSRRRTAFDRPASRLSFRLVAEETR